MTTSSIQDHLYRSRHFLTSEAEGQHNLMHLFFLILQSSPERSNDIIRNGLLVFWGTFNSSPCTPEVILPSYTFMSMCHYNMYILCFNILQHQETVPKLKDLLEKSFPTSLDTTHPLTVDIVEGLFAHFFSEQQQFYDDVDIQSFLEIANKQHEWQVPQKHDLLLKENLKEIQVKNSCLLLSVFKKYLMRILLQCSDDSKSFLLFYHKGSKVITMLS